MILNKNQRKAATTAFESESPELRGKLLNATVRIDSDKGWGSGIIFFVAGADAFVITAKHVLQTLLSSAQKEFNGDPRLARSRLLIQETDALLLPEQVAWSAYSNSSQ